MIARSGSIDGKSGSVISPAPSCLRDVRELEWLVRFEPAAPRVIGEDPVPVVIADVPDKPPRPESEPPRRDEPAEAAAGLFTSA
jgi:hypothetical protein